ncbi:MAG: 6-phosphofructokinase [Treponema sp.]|nr:6-phosphofructokinase [Treponema sp.]
MSKTSVKKVGILTSGGDAPGLNAAIRGVCRAGMIHYGMEFVGIKNGYRGLVQGNCVPLTSKDLSGILTLGGTLLGTSREKPFKAKEPNAETGLMPVEAIKKNYKKMGLDALVCLGGNGTNTTASLLSDEGLNVIGLPKTIDNDIVFTDMTFGFHTALDVATEAIDRIHTTAHSHSRIMVIEVMGHKAGWLGLYSGIAGGGDVILLPEIPYDIEKVAESVMSRKEAGKEFSIVIVAEGALSKKEAKLEKKAFKKKRAEMPYSIAYRVAQELEEATKLESRVTVLGYLQRGGTPSPYDRVLASQYGVAAADFLAKEKFGNLVALQNNKIVAVPLKDVAGKVKNVPLDHPMLLAGRNLGTSFGD